jgi:hypothetical protein
MKKTFFLIGTAALAASLLACAAEEDGPEDPITGDGDTGGTTGDGDGSGGGAGTDDADFVIGGLGTGTSTDGIVWNGYTFTAKAEASSIMPTEFMGSNLCVSGTLAAGYEEWALVGWNIAQEIDPDTQMGGAVLSIAPGSTGVNVQVKNNGGSGLRVQIQTDDTGVESWCVEVPPAGGNILWSEFRKQCWTATGEAYDGVTPIAQVAIQTYSGSDTLPTQFDYCVLHVGPAI